MTEELQEIKRAKELLQTTRYAAMATVNADGSPHNTPFKFMHNESLTHVYWGSHPESQHSQNILRTGQLFVVVYDAVERGGLYIRASGGHPLEGKELDEALAAHNVIRKREGKASLQKSYYTGDSPQRMWSATITNLWVNGEERDVNGRMIKDYRIEIEAEELIG